MTTVVTADLVTIDFDSETVNNNEFDVIEKVHHNSIQIHNQEIDDLLPDVSFKDILEDSETNLIGESQPLLGADHHDHITYNQFPGKISFVIGISAHTEQLERNFVPHLERCSSYLASTRTLCRGNS